MKKWKRKSLKFVHHLKLVFRYNLTLREILLKNLTLDTIKKVIEALKQKNELYVGELMAKFHFTLSFFSLILDVR